jgi:hypothetical protein
LPWDCDRFAAKAKDTIENEEQTSASNISLFQHEEKVDLGLVENPCILIDKHGRILLWYLPGVLSHRNVRRFHSISIFVGFSNSLT